MPVSVSCPSCETRLNVPDKLAGEGRTVKCPKCGGTFKLTGAGETATKPAARAPQPAAAPAKRDKDVDRLDSADDEDEERARPRKSSRDRDDEDEERARPRKSSKDRDDDEEDDDRPRARKKRPRDDDEDDDYDDRPARRKARKGKKKSGGNLGLIIGLAAGGAVLLLGCCGVGAYFLITKAGGLVDNPAVTQANFDKVQMDMTLQAVEGIFGPGGDADGGDMKALLMSGGGGPMGVDDRLMAAADNPQTYGITGWYRWKNGPTRMIIAVDGARKVRVAGLVTATNGGHSSSWKSSLQAVGGGAPQPPGGGGAPPPQKPKGRR
jgi:predicted Zn finger-like uncharacterized protein